MRAHKPRTDPHLRPSASQVSIVTDHTLVSKTYTGASSNLRKGLKKRARNEAINALLSLSVTATVYLGNLQYFANGYREDRLTDAVRIVGLLMSAVQVLIVFRQFRVQWRRTIDGRHKAGCRLIVEVGVHLLVLPPRVNATHTFYFLGTSAVVSLSDFYFLLAAIRLYHILLYLYYSSTYLSRKAEFHW